MRPTGTWLDHLGSGFNFIYFSETTDNGLTPAFSLDAGPPPVTLNLPNLDPTLQNGFGADYVNSDSGKTGRTYTWVFDLQRELPGGILLDAAYVGQRGINMPAGLETINQVPGKYLSLGSLLNAMSPVLQRLLRDKSAISGVYRIGGSGTTPVSAVPRHCPLARTHRNEYVPWAANEDTEAVLQGTVFPGELHGFQDSFQCFRWKCI